jgi:polar amino acid transport system substrate-binding protein
MNQRHFLSMTFLLAGMISPIGAAWAADNLKLIYEDRPPYYMTAKNGQVRGLAIDPVTAGFKKAGITSNWVVRSAKRQIADIKANREAVCSPGWFKKPEREAFAKFSNPIYQDLPQVIVARADNVHRIPHTTLEQMFKDSKLRIGAKLGYSYGAFVDKLLGQHKPATVRTAQGTGGLVRMLLGRRFDYMVAAPEEVSSLTERLGIAGSDIASVIMSDIPPGNFRYLMCSKQVSDETLRRFNEGLARLAQPKN